MSIYEINGTTYEIDFFETYPAKKGGWSWYRESTDSQGELFETELESLQEAIATEHEKIVQAQLDEYDEDYPDPYYIPYCPEHP